MPNHNWFHHRRQARDAFAFPDPKAIASALAEPFPGPNPFADAEAEATPVQTLVSVVYVTASATFDGPVGGYKTLGQDDDDDDEEEEKTTTKKSTQEKTVEAEKTTAKSTATSEKSSIVADTSAEPKQSVKQTTLATSTGLPSVISSPTTTLSTATGLLAATGSVSNTKTHEYYPPRSSATAAESESTSAADSTKAESMSPGGKAGLAIGILLLIGAILAIVLFVFKRRKDKAKQEALAAQNEKAEKAEKAAAMYAGAGRASSTRTTATAPRLSLRPVTQFLPGFAGEKRSSRGNALDMASGQSQQRNVNQDQNRNNPFGNHAETIDSANANGPAQINVTSPTGEIVIATAAGAAAGATAGLARSASKSQVNKPQDFTTKGGFMGPPSPSGTEFSMTSEHSTPIPSGTGAAIAAAGGPANSAVHRVQLDFKPSMEDEIELKAGQLIRLLHEYDDGWVSRAVHYLINKLTPVGSLHSSGSFSTRCCSSYMSINSSR